MQPIQQQKRIRRRPIPGLEDLAARSSLSANLLAVMDEAGDSINSNNRTLAAVVEKAPDLASRIMKLAGSPVYQTREPATDIEAAVRTLGRRVILSCALQQGVCSFASNGGELVRRIAAHLLVVAVISRSLTRVARCVAPEDAFMAGLLHDYGKLAIASAEPNLYQSVVDLCRSEGLRAGDAERRVLRAEITRYPVHAQIGAEILERMAIDAGIVEAVRRHHDDHRSHVRSWGDWSLSGIVHVANELAHRVGLGDGSGSASLGEYLTPSLWDRLDRPAHDLDAFVREALDEVSPLLAHTNLAMPPHALEDDRKRLSEKVTIELAQEDVEASDPVIDADAASGAERIAIDTNAFGPVTDLGWSPFGATLAMTFRDGCVRTWSAETWREQGQSDALDGAATGLTWSPNNESLAVGGDDGSVRLLDRESLRRLRTIVVDDVGIHALAWSSDHRLIATGGARGAVTLCNRSETRPEEPSNPLGWQRGMITDLSWGPGGHTLASASADGSIALWDIATRQFRRALSGHAAPVCCVDWAPSGEYIASGSEDCGVRIWDPGDGSCREILHRHADGVVRISHSFGGRLLATLSRDGHVYIWRCDSWTCVGDLEFAPDNDRYCLLGAGLAFHPQRSLLACTAPREGVVRVLEIDGGGEMRDPRRRSRHS